MGELNKESASLRTAGHRNEAEISAEVTVLWKTELAKHIGCLRFGFLTERKQRYGA